MHAWISPKKAAKHPPGNQCSTVHDDCWCVVWNCSTNEWFKYSHWFDQLFLVRMIYTMRFWILSRVATNLTSLVPPHGVDGMEITAKRGARPAPGHRPFCHLAKTSYLSPSSVRSCTNANMTLLLDSSHSLKTGLSISMWNVRIWSRSIRRAPYFIQPCIVDGDHSCSLCAGNVKWCTEQARLAFVWFGEVCSC